MVILFFSPIFRPEDRLDVYRNRLSPLTNIFFYGGYTLEYLRYIWYDDEVSSHQMSVRNLQNWTPNMHLNLALRSWLAQLEARQQTTKMYDASDSVHCGPLRDHKENVGGGVMAVVESVNSQFSSLIIRKNDALKKPPTHWLRRSMYYLNQGIVFRHDSWAFFDQMLATRFSCFDSIPTTWAHRILCKWYYPYCTNYYYTTIIRYANIANHSTSVLM